MKNIEEFQGEYRWLSNFWPCDVQYDGNTYKSTENAYQAAKCSEPTLRAIFMNCTPGEAKRAGRTMPLRQDWEQVKLSIMEDLLRQKFSQPEFRQKLKATGSLEIIEGNKWNDTFWGVCKGIGQNHLGKIIMKIRSELE